MPRSREIHVLEDLEPEAGIRSFIAEAAAAKMRLDAYLAKALPHISRGRVQLLIENGQVTVNGSPRKASHKLRGGEQIDIEGEPQPAPLRAEPEDLPLDIVYEDDDLAVINKAAGMTVHAGAGYARRQPRHARQRSALSLRQTAFCNQRQICVPASCTVSTSRPAASSSSQRTTSLTASSPRSFAARDLRKVYIALVHGNIKGDEGTVDLPVSRDLVRRTRMTTRRADGRHAVSHWRVLERIEGAHGKFTLLEVRIETGRTHQIRVHMQSLGHPIVGDTLYGAPHHITRTARSSTDETLTLDRNFLHAAELDFTHPRTGKPLEFRAPLPPELTSLLDQLRTLTNH